MSGWSPSSANSAVLLRRLPGSEHGPGRLAALVALASLASIAGCRPAVCGDGVCDLTEGCGSCSRDCGACGTGHRRPYEACLSTSDCMNARDYCLSVMNRTI